MYRVMNCKIVMLFVGSLFLSACGQSGALHLPKDAQADKRAQYLLYKDANAAKNTEEKNSSVAP